MQIHELTKLSKKLEEGILDDVKATVRTAKAGYKAGGVGGALKTLSDPRAFARQQNAVYKNKNKAALTDLEKSLNKGKKPGDPGYWHAPGSPEYAAQQAAKKVTSNPQAVQQINNLTAQFQDTFGTPMPAPGNKFVLPADKTGYQADYYMSDKGIWTNDETPPKQITDPATIQKLNSMVDAGAAKEVPKNDVAVEPVKKTKSNKATTVAERSSNVRRQQRLKTGVTQSNKKLPLTDFGNWAKQNIPDIDTALKNPDAKVEIETLANQIKTSGDVEKATPIFKKLMTTVLSTTGSSDGNSSYGSTSSGRGPLVPADQLINTIKTQGINGLVQVLSNDPPRQKTGSKSLDNLLDKAGLLESELYNELQAFKAEK